MSFEIKADGVDVEAIHRAIRKRIEEKKGGLYDDDELQALSEETLEPVLEAADPGESRSADERRVTNPAVGG